MYINTLKLESVYVCKHTWLVINYLDFVWSSQWQLVKRQLPINPYTKKNTFDQNFKMYLYSPKITTKFVSRHFTLRVGLDHILKFSVKTKEENIVSGIRKLFFRKRDCLESACSNTVLFLSIFK